MNKRKPSKKATGIPENITPKLRQALAKELELMGATYEQAIYGIDPPPSPELVLELIQRWNRLTPEQHAAWDRAAEHENQRQLRHPKNYPN